MKRLLSLALLALFLLSLAACASRAKTPEAVPSAAAPAALEQPASAAPAPEPEPEPEPVWRYEMETKTIEEEYVGEGNVKLATISLAYPEMTAVCDGGDGSGGPPAELQAVIDAFNGGVRDYIGGLETAAVLGELAQVQYNEMDPEYRDKFPTYYALTVVAAPYERGDLLEVSIFHSAYWGGAHGGADIKNLHFDRARGVFVELSSLTDQPERLHDMISEDIINGIFDRGEEDWYFDDFFKAIRERRSYNVSFGEDGVSVIFDEYEIAPYAAGLPEFTIPYEKLWRFLNDRGERLLDLPLETRILGDYYDALEMWYWFEGSVPMDYDDSRSDIYITPYGEGEMPYLRVVEPGVSTMTELKARLASRFSDRVIDERLNGSTLFREFDGVLYAAAAGRGVDWTVESVDYTVELDAARRGGRVLADVHRRDYDDRSGEWIPSGVTERVEYPFVLGTEGAVFSAFPTIW